MKAEGKANAELLFTKSHSTGTRGHSMTLVGGKLKIARRRKYFFTQQVSNFRNLLPQEGFFMFIYEKGFQTRPPPYFFSRAG